MLSHGARDTAGGEFCNVLGVRVHTDAGIIGLGETPYGAVAVEAHFHDTLAQRLLGRDPPASDALNRDMFALPIAQASTAVEYRADSAVDIALRDIAKPCARLVTEYARSTSVWVCGSETLGSRFPYKHRFDRHAIHLVMVDVSWTCDLTEARKIAALADSYHCQFAAHDCIGPDFIAGVHATFSQPDTLIQESVRAFYSGWLPRWSRPCRV